MIETRQYPIPNGITLSCRVAGPPGAPLMVFLHGFPEAAFIWDAMLEHFSRPEHGDYRCVAPNLRGFENSSAPIEVEAYKAHLLIGDLLALIAADTGDAHARIDTLVAHDWGGAFAWGLANAHPQRLRRLVIINSPHPGTFARELQNNPVQQTASAYMNFLSRPDAESLLAEDDYRRMWAFFTGMGAGPDRFGWLTDEVKARYRAVWDQGLRGACNLYRVTPLKPAEPGQPLRTVTIPRERLMIEVPTLVIWALDDAALLPGLIEGLQDYVPRLTLRQVPDATHWIVHEQPNMLAKEIETFIARNAQS